MTWFTEDLSISTYWSVSFQLSIKFGHGNLWIHKCKVSHFKHSGEKFILYYKCSYNMKCWQFNSWIANTFTFYKYLHMLVVLLVLARCWQINWPCIYNVITKLYIVRLLQIAFKIFHTKIISQKLNQMSSNFVSVDGTVSWLLEVPQVGEKLMVALESLLSSSFGVFPWHRCQIFDDDLKKLF